MDVGLLQASLEGILQVLEKVCSLMPIVLHTSVPGVPPAPGAGRERRYSGTISLLVVSGTRLTRHLLKPRLSASLLTLPTFTVNWGGWDQGVMLR